MIDTNRCQHAHLIFAHGRAWCLFHYPNIPPPILRPRMAGNKGKRKAAALEEASSNHVAFSVPTVKRVQFTVTSDAGTKKSSRVFDRAPMQPEKLGSHPTPASEPNQEPEPTDEPPPIKITQVNFRARILLKTYNNHHQFRMPNFSKTFSVILRSWAVISRQIKPSRFS